MALICSCVTCTVHMYVTVKDAIKETPKAGLWCPVPKNQYQGHSFRIIPLIPETALSRLQETMYNVCSQ